MKELNEIISMYQDYPGGVLSIRGQVRCRSAGYLRLHLCQKYQEPEVPTVDLRNEMDFEREAREKYEAEQNTSPYIPKDYLAFAKSYAAVLLETYTASIRDTSNIQSSIDFMCQPAPYWTSEEVNLLTAPEMEVQKQERIAQVASWRKHEEEICQTIAYWMSSDVLAGCDYPENLPEMLQKAVGTMLKGIRKERVKFIKGKGGLTKEAYDAGVLDLTKLQNSF
jgi:hypothetical protein